MGKFVKKKRKIVLGTDVNTKVYKYKVLLKREKTKTELMSNVVDTLIMVGDN